MRDNKRKLQTLTALEQRLRFIQTKCDKADGVFADWRNSKKYRGFDYFIAKCRVKLNGQNHKYDAIPCRDKTEAIWVCSHFGDWRLLVNGIPKLRESDSSERKARLA